MTQRTFDERINELVERQEQLKAQEKALRKRQSEVERKKRTRRLIETGAIVESVLGRPLTDQDKVRFEYFLRLQEQRGSFFSKAMNDDSIGGDAND